MLQDVVVGFEWRRSGMYAESTKMPHGIHERQECDMPAFQNDPVSSTTDSTSAAVKAENTKAARECSAPATRAAPA